jgi:hypothetical protein
MISANGFPVQPPVETLRHGKILGYYLGYKATNSTDPFRYQTLEVTDVTVSILTNKSFLNILLNKQ